MDGFKIALVNLSEHIKNELTFLIRSEKLGSYSFVNTKNLPEYFSDGANNASLIVLYAPELNEQQIIDLKAPPDTPVVLLVEQIDFEKERTAKANGVDLLLDSNDAEVVNLVYGFIRQFGIYQGNKALIVDDSNVDSQVTSHILNAEFIENIIERNPQHVLELLHTDDRINIVVLDYEMPYLNGCALMRAIRKEFPERSFMFIGLTGSRNGAIKFLNEGATNVFQKPLDPELFSVSLRRSIFSYHQLHHEKQMLQDYRQIIGRVAHDIRNPINILATVNEKLTMAMDGDEMAVKLRQLSDSACKNIEKIFEELLGYVELTSYKKTNMLQSCSLKSLIATQLYLEAQQAKYKDIIIKQKINIDAYIHCVPAQIESVITNLTNNAVKYSKIGGIIDVRLFIEHHNIVFEVEDSSPKIAANDLHSLFSPFAKASNIVPTGGEKSIGLGLVICKEIINAHGGEIGVKHGDHGNVFYFKLPCQDDGHRQHLH